MVTRHLPSDNCCPGLSGYFVEVGELVPERGKVGNDLPLVIVTGRPLWFDVECIFSRLPCCHWVFFHCWSVLSYEEVPVTSGLAGKQLYCLPKPALWSWIMHRRAHTHTTHKRISGRLVKAFSRVRYARCLCR